MENHELALSPFFGRNFFVELSFGVAGEVNGVFLFTGEARQAGIKGICHGFPHHVAVNRMRAAEWLSTFRVFGTPELTSIRTILLSRSLAR